jgi:hypothetical protein
MQAWKLPRKRCCPKSFPGSRPRSRSQAIGRRWPAREVRSTQAAVVPSSVSSWRLESARTRRAERERTDPRRRGRATIRAPSASERAATSGGAQAASTSPRRTASVSAS